MDGVKMRKVKEFCYLHFCEQVLAFKNELKLMDVKSAIIGFGSGL
jgi:hypothetical protein